MRSGHTRIRSYWRLGVLGLLPLLLSLVACKGGKPAPTATLTPFAPQTVPTPSSIEHTLSRRTYRRPGAWSTWTR